ncbi:peptide ABC transporter ATPase [Oceanicola sp. 22II-s10i]|uniref:type I secretion system permease/ATPase n=1 Tax=Oceanicola sp. 22II-s10i TaxID=1317116 RepID=UPI000B52386E|nr:type I secretion system permease/ATPase [Oceanicola sp. 22II-s10i]OWU86351.1 peptide ABC transporter ATPase [Oceanicola sp. 22II-s10i]
MSTQYSSDPGLEELRAVRRESRHLFWAAALFSAFANILMLTGPLYMLQVYDRVLSSRSTATLLALSTIVAFMFLIMGLLDLSRTRILARIGARFQSRLDGRVFDAVIRRAAIRPDALSASGLRDLESIQKLLGSPALVAMFDIPWTPVFLAGISLFHPMLGLLALAGGALLVCITLLNQWISRGPQLDSMRRTMAAEQISDQLRNEAEMLQAMGMRDAAFARWNSARDAALAAQLAATDTTVTFSSIGKTFRLFLQSAMLGLGAYLVLQGELSAGAMIAGSILLGRALAPIEMAIAQWPMITRARSGWRSLGTLLTEIPPEPRRTELPRPRARLEVSQATVIPPGDSVAALRIVSFNVEPGQAVGVIGPSGAGKSTLARALTGAWRVAGGKIRLDGASLDQFDPTARGNHIGYLPQRVQLFDGTIAENIARLSPEPDDQKVIAAAKLADAHEMILKLPDGYDTRVTANGGRLSGGQIQRIGLARAMYSDPVLLVLDEPNANLDNEGSMALNGAIRALKARGCSVLIMAHRPAAIQECDLLLMLENGSRVAFGPKDEVLREVVQNHKQIQQASGPGGVR